MRQRNDHGRDVQAVERDNEIMRYTESTYWTVDALRVYEAKEYLFIYVTTFRGPLRDKAISDY